MVYKSHWRGLQPASCLLCGVSARGSLDLCCDCAADLPAHAGGCSRCAMPLACPDDTLCGQCLREPPAFSACVAALRYEHPVRELLSRFKFQGDLAAGRMLSGLLAARLATLPASVCPDLLLAPVPLHPARLRERGFNQSERIARVLAAELGLARSNALLWRTQHTVDQKRLGAAARSRNLRGAFRATGCAGRRVVLVDDVITTGATADAAAQALLGGGATEVRVWCLARAL